jgi:hypothetical protein
MNEYFELEGEKGSGLGTRFFARAATSAQAVGVAEMTCHAARGEDDRFNGYYTWARLGCDGPIPHSTKLLLPDEWSHFTKVSEIMKQGKKGRDWWKAHGDDWNATFSLKKTGYSMKTLKSYLKERGFKE